MEPKLLVIPGPLDYQLFSWPWSLSSPNYGRFNIMDYRSLCKLLNEGLWKSADERTTSLQMVLSPVVKNGRFPLFGGSILKIFNDYFSTPSLLPQIMQSCIQTLTECWHDSPSYRPSAMSAKNSLDKLLPNVKFSKYSSK